MLHCDDSLVLLTGNLAYSRRKSSLLSPTSDLQMDPNNLNSLLKDFQIDDTFMSEDNPPKTPQKQLHFLQTSSNVDRLSTTSTEYNNLNSPKSPLIQHSQPRLSVSSLMSPLSPPPRSSSDRREDSGSEINSQLLTMLCAYESGFDVLTERIKQSIVSAKECSTFLKKRAIIEEEYGRQMLKLVATSAQNTRIEAIQDSFQDGYQNFLNIHERVGQIRFQNANSISLIGDDLITLQKNSDRSRKQLKDNLLRHWKLVQESESLLAKEKGRYDLASEEWERCILIKEGLHGESGRKNDVGLSKSVSNPMNLWKQASGKGSKDPNKILRNEEDAKSRVAQFDESYKQQLAKTNQVRKEYYTQNYPKIISSLKDASEDCEKGLRNILLKYAHEFENAVLKEAQTLSPIPTEETEKNFQPGIIASLQEIHTKQDFETYIKTHLQTTKPPPTTAYTEIQYVAYQMSSKKANEIANPVQKRFFGVPLREQLERDAREVPVVLERCVEWIEGVGVESSGIYRLSGTSTKVQALKNSFERVGADVVVADFTMDINDVTGVLKLYFRELPERLFTNELYTRFIEAAGIEDERVRAVSMHELVNLLPDANYSTLRMLMAHLWKVQEAEEVNKMNIKNLSIVFGPSLVDVSTEVGQAAQADFRAQAMVVEIVLTNFKTIFD